MKLTYTNSELQHRVTWSWIQPLWSSPGTRARENSVTLPAFLWKDRFRRYGNEPSTQHDVTKRRLQ